MISHFARDSNSTYEMDNVQSLATPWAYTPATRPIPFGLSSVYRSIVMSPADVSISTDMIVDLSYGIGLIEVELYAMRRTRIFSSS